MVLQSPIAARAVHFMRQCRIQQRQHAVFLQRTTVRTVSSSHLAPSNFSKQTRRRDTEIEYPRFADLPSRQTTSKKRNLQPPSHVPSTPIPPGFISFLKYRILNFPPPPPPAHKPPPFNVLNNPWRTKKKWPPDFDSMHPKQQFHFEKTFRRRMLLKTQSKRYNWNRYIRLLQQSLIIITVVYFIFIADPYAKDGGGTPVDGFRAWFFGQIAKFEHMPEGLRESANELNEYYAKNWKKAPWSEGEAEGQEKAEDAASSTSGVEGVVGKETT